MLFANEIGEFTSYFYYESPISETCYASDSMMFIANGADFSIVADSILCDGDTASLGLQIASVSANGPWSLSWEPSGQTFQPLEVHPNTTTTYIASITDANNCISTDTLILDVLCSNETIVDFEPFNVENETQSLLDFLRKELNNGSIQLKLHVSALENQKISQLTSRERFFQMAEKNPDLHLFKEEFDLDLEY